ncbi:hypothetical protein OPV22_023970 [Ensete ventricosum]|uniref:Uncharacterized protein n=1 Tax=Ensete ventricosum TaxID=4639 RepID=A0AAV8QRV2_ENSVE|nr:hypothetical protein OPV22_023970 [Ensete ventricosum]
MSAFTSAAAAFPPGDHPCLPGMATKAYRMRRRSNRRSLRLVSSSTVWLRQETKLRHKSEIDGSLCACRSSNSGLYTGHASKIQLFIIYFKTNSTSHLLICFEISPSVDQKAEPDKAAELPDISFEELLSEQRNHKPRSFARREAISPWLTIAAHRVYFTIASLFLFPLGCTS